MDSARWVTQLMVPGVKANRWDRGMNTATSFGAGTVWRPQGIRYDPPSTVRVVGITKSMKARFAPAGAMRWRELPAHSPPA